MSLAIIINPVAGTDVRPSVARRRAELASAVAAAQGENAEVFVTERRGHARELAAGAVSRGARLVLAWGGDGTVNEVGAALAFGPTPLAIVASGSGNGLARELGVDRRPERAIADAIHAAPRAIDAGELGGRLFFNVAGIGFDAQVAARFDDLAGARRGLLTYALITAWELLTYSPCTYRISAGGAETSQRAFLVTLANSPQFGNGVRIAPGARVDDGRLDLVVFEEVSRLSTICATPRLFKGDVRRVRGVSIRQIERVVIDADRPMTFHADGEPVRGGVQLEGRVLPGALRVCVR